jgi:hypothetical protein
MTRNHYAMSDSTVSRSAKQQEPSANHPANGNGHSPIPPFAPAAPAADPFDPSQYRLSQDFAANVGVKKLLTTVPVRRAGNQAFVRVHPAEAYRMQTYLLQLKGDGDSETYLVNPSLWSALAGESAMVPKILFLATTRQGVLHLWDIRLPGPDGKLDQWNESAREAAQIAMTRWVRVVSDKNLGAYAVYEATGELPEPEWPDMSMRDILAVGFKGRVIDSLDHPVLRRLRGEA